MCGSWEDDQRSCPSHSWTQVFIYIFILWLAASILISLDLLIYKSHHSFTIPISLFQGIQRPVLKHWGVHWCCCRRAESKTLNYYFKVVNPFSLPQTVVLALVFLFWDVIWLIIMHCYDGFNFSPSSTGLNNVHLQITMKKFGVPDQNQITERLLRVTQTMFVYRITVIDSNHEG